MRKCIRKSIRTAGHKPEKDKEENMHKFKVALVQYDTAEPKNAENTEFAIKLIREAKRENADFVLFPEGFITSYSAPNSLCIRIPAAI